MLYLSSKLGVVNIYLWPSVGLLTILEEKGMLNCSRRNSSLIQTNLRATWILVSFPTGSYRTNQSVVTTKISFLKYLNFQRNFNCVNIDFLPNHLQNEIRYELITDEVIVLYSLNLNQSNFHWFISEKIFFTAKSVNFHWNNQWNLTDLQ